MTTTTTRNSTPSLPRLEEPGHRRQPRRRLALALVAAAVLVVITSLAIGLSGDVRTSPAPPRPPDIAGTYRLDDGADLTVWGAGEHPIAEIDGRVLHLRSDGAGGHRSVEGTLVLRIEEGDRDVVHLTADGEADRRGRRVELHREEPVAFSSGSVDLQGTLFVPTGEGPHPAVVIVHGAELADRDTYRLLASHLARNGVAALTYDKRGTGASAGSATGATFEDLTDDALAGVATLTGRADVRADRVGVLGFSQGAWVVARAARRSDDIAFVIGYSAAGFSPADQQAWLHGSMLAARGFGPAAMRIADRVDRMLYSSVDLVDAGVIPPIPHVPGFWFHALELHLDSTALWEDVDQPVLLAWGELDCQVPAAGSHAALTAALHRGGNSHVSTVVFPGADHSFTLVPPCGNEIGLAHHGGHAFADGYLGLAPAWIHGLDSARAVPRAARAPAQHVDGVLGWHLDPPAPAPWYGAIVPQLGAVLALLGLFAGIAWRAVRRHPPATALRAVLITTGLVGVLATATVLAAFAEIAVLGDTHAAFLVGGPTVTSASLLMHAARAAVAATTVGAGVAVIVGARTRTLSGALVLLLVATALLSAWARYWGLAPLG